MNSLVRFGRKIIIPSTRQIRHQLRQLMDRDEQQSAEAKRPSVASVAVPLAPVDIGPDEVGPGENTADNELSLRKRSDAMHEAEQ